MSLGLPLVEMALAVTAASVTISRTQVTEGLRDWLSSRSRLLSDLLICPYCISHYLAAVGALFLVGDSFIEYIVDVGAIIAISALVTGVIFRLLLKDQAEVARLNRELGASRKMLADVLAEME